MPPYLGLRVARLGDSFSGLPRGVLSVLLLELFWSVVQPSGQSPIGMLSVLLLEPFWERLVTVLMAV